MGFIKYLLSYHHLLSVDAVSPALCEGQIAIELRWENSIIAINTVFRPFNGEKYSVGCLLDYEGVIGCLTHDQISAAATFSIQFEEDVAGIGLINRNFAIFGKCISRIISIYNIDFRPSRHRFLQRIAV